MAIQLIDTATPQVGLKGGAAKINANFTDSENAASRLVQSSPTDTTDGALMAVGAFGLGASNAPIPTETNADNYLTAGTFSCANITSGLPSEVNTAASITVIPRLDGSSDHEFTQIVEWRGQTLRRFRQNGTWSEWQRIDPQAFGLGAKLGGSIDPNTVSDSTQVFFSSQAEPNAPSGDSGWHITHFANTTSGYASQIAVAADNPVSMYIRTQDSGTWSDWKRTDPQAFGWGLDTGLNSSADLNTYLTSGQYSVQSASPNNPTGNAILTVGVRNSTNVTQHLQATIASNGSYERTLSAGIWSEWQPVYTGANLILHKWTLDSLNYFPFPFVKAASSERIAIIPTYSDKPVTSITVTGSMELYTGSLVTGLDSSNILLEKSGAGYAFIKVTQYNISGDTWESNSYLRGVSGGTASLEFNF